MIPQPVQQNRLREDISQYKNGLWRPFLAVKTAAKKPLKKSKKVLDKYDSYVYNESRR